MMKKYIIPFAIASLGLVACEKWTETESMANTFEEVAINNLKEIRDEARWKNEAQLTEDSKASLEAYWAQLREYKRRAWLNGGEAVGQKPMFYFWFGAPRWNPAVGVPSSFLQSVPDSVACISIWGGLGGKLPKELTELQKKDLEIFHKKGSAVIFCWQTPSVGTGLPGKPDGSMNGHYYFREKYPFTETKDLWGEIYARELSRYIIALGFDGYDVDWETCGDHGSVSEEGTPMMVGYDDLENSHISKFVREMAKYFGPVGEKHLVKTQAEREANLKALFDINTAGYHPNEKEFIDEFLPYLPKDYLTKRYYFCADVPCGVAAIFDTGSFELYFDKHFMQDYAVAGVGGHIKMLGGKYYNSTSLDIQTQRDRIGFRQFWKKGEAINKKQVWGFAMYHGELDYTNTIFAPEMLEYRKQTGATRNYTHHAITREIIRIADPRPSYAGYKEELPLIIIP